MAMKKLEENSKKRIEKLCALVLGKGEKRKLYELCIKYGIPIIYPDLFMDNNDYYLWEISNDGIGLVGTIIMHHLKQNNGKIFHSLNELEEYLRISINKGNY